MVVEVPAVLDVLVLKCVLLANTVVMRIAVVVCIATVVDFDSTLQLQPLTFGVQFVLHAAHHWVFSKHDQPESWQHLVLRQF
jgi:hypothetical protein